MSSSTDPPLVPPDLLFLSPSVAVPPRSPSPVALAVGSSSSPRAQVSVPPPIPPVNNPQGRTGADLPRSPTPVVPDVGLSSPEPRSCKPPPTSPEKVVDGEASDVKAATPDPRWPYLSRWSGSNSSLATTKQDIEHSVTKVSTQPGSAVVPDPAPEPVDTLEAEVAEILPQVETCALSDGQSSQVGDLTKPPSSPLNIDGTGPEVVLTEPLMKSAPTAIHESPVAPAAVQDSSPVAPAAVQDSFPVAPVKPNLPTGTAAPLPQMSTDPQLNPPSSTLLAGSDLEHDKAAIGDRQPPSNRNPTQPPSLKGAWTKKLKFLPISALGHSQQTHDQHDVSKSVTAEDDVRFPWAAKMNPSSRNLYRAVEPEYIEDGTPKVTIPPHVLLQGLENQKEYVLGQFYRCSLPPGGLIYAVFNNLWGRKCKITIRKLGASSYLFHIPEESTRNWVLSRGLWHVDDCLMFVAPWTPEASLAIPEIKTIPVWVTLKNIPSILYSIRGISHIASGLGAPMATHKPRLDPIFMGEAKILVEVELSKAFPPRIAADDKNGVIWMVDVEYAWLPSTCTRCGQLGHKARRCLQPAESLVHVAATETHLSALAESSAAVNTTTQLVPTNTTAASPPQDPVCKALQSEPLIVSEEGTQLRANAPSPIRVTETQSSTVTNSTMPVKDSIPIAKASATKPNENASIMHPPEKIVAPNVCLSPKTATSLPASTPNRVNVRESKEVVLPLGSNQFAPLVSCEKEDVSSFSSEEEEESLLGIESDPTEHMTPSGKRILRERPVKPTTKAKEMSWQTVGRGRGNRGRGKRGGRGSMPSSSLS